MNKKEELIEKIRHFENKYFNEQQKQIAIKILENAPIEEVQSYADFIFMKRRTGFAFDYSPEIAKGRLITLKEDKNRRINLSDAIVSEKENKLIIGDNYNALKALCITHKEKIDVIYIDPPYNTESAKNDGNQSSKEGESSKFLYKDKFGRGGWLNMMKERLTLAKELLSKEGVIFVSIDDSEQAYLKVLMDDIFGEDNFLTSFIWERTHHSNKNNSGKKVFRNVDYILSYSKSFSSLKLFTEGKQKDFGDAPLFNKANKIKKLVFPKGTVFLKKENKTNKKDLIIEFNSRWSQKKIDEEISLGTKFIIKGNNNKAIRAIYHNEKEGYKIPNQLLNTSTCFTENFGYVTTENGTANLNKIIGKDKFPYPKPHELIEYLVNLKQNNNLIVLDFFAGSGTTGQAIMELNRKDNGNRKFILCTNNENSIADKITYERLYRIIKGKTLEGKKDFKWLSKNVPYENENLRVINIDDSIKISLDENISSSIYDDAKKGLQLLDNKYNKKDLNFYYDLAALNPLENKEDKFEDGKCN